MKVIKKDIKQMNKWELITKWNKQQAVIRTITQLVYTRSDVNQLNE